MGAVRWRLLLAALGVWRALGFVSIIFDRPLPHPLASRRELCGVRASTATCLGVIGGFVAAMLRIRRHLGPVLLKSDPLWTAFALLIIAAIQGLLWLNAFGVSFGSPATVYVVALLLGLGEAAFMFLRLLIPRG